MKTTGNAIGRSFIRCAVPGILALMLNSVYVVVDGLFVARLIGRDALAAVTVAVPMMEIMIALAMLISVGAGVSMSTLRGKGDLAAARQVFMHSVVLMGVLSLVLCVGGLLLRGPIGGLLGATAEIAPLAEEYLMYLFAFCPFLMLNFGLCTWVRNDGKHTLALTAMGIGAVVNIVLDYVFIAWCGLGIGGAALATGLGPLVGCAILLPHFIRRRGDIYFEPATFSLRRFAEIISLGIPSFAMEFSLGLTTLCVNIAVSHHLGALGLATYGVVGYVALIVITVFLGMAEGTQPLFSFYTGMDDRASVKGLLRLSLVVATACGLLGFLLLFFLARYPALLFGGHDQALVDSSIYAIRLYFPMLFATGINIVCASCLQSMGRWKPSIAISLLRSLGFLALFLLTLPMVLGEAGLWLAVPAAELCTMPIAFLLTGKVMGREKRPGFSLKHSLRQ